MTHKNQWIIEISSLNIFINITYINMYMCVYTQAYIYIYIYIYIYMGGGCILFFCLSVFHSRPSCLSLHLAISLTLYIYIYIYSERESEREREGGLTNGQ